MKTEEQIREQYQQIRGSLDERGRREWAALEALTIGHGGNALVHRGTEMAPSTIAKGIRELRQRSHGEALPEAPGRVRRPGGGRPRKTAQDPELLAALEGLVEPRTPGDPGSPLRWTCKGLRVLAAELTTTGHAVSYRTVSRLLQHLQYSHRGNMKTVEGDRPADRMAQFSYINAQIQKRLDGDYPAICVDTRKKELIVACKNAGREHRPQGKPSKVDVHDSRGESDRVNPDGACNLHGNSRWVSVGISAVNSESVVESVRRWWNAMGHERYPRAGELLITADCDGSNDSRTQLWKLEIQDLADEVGIPITVCHFPPGTSKWNAIEHRLSSCVTFNWRGKPLRAYRAVVNLIAATTTKAVVEVHRELDAYGYEKVRKVSDAEMDAVRIRPHEFHGRWNYTIDPHDA